VLVSLQVFVVILSGSEGSRGSKLIPDFPPLSNQNFNGFPEQTPASLKASFGRKDCDWRGWAKENGNGGAFLVVTRGSDFSFGPKSTRRSVNH
jgi:hypothetical protein